MSYFNRKIENYKLQDRKGKRQIPKEGYVNAEWFLEKTLIAIITADAVLV